jgi:hypothetical protein
LAAAIFLRALDTAKYWRLSVHSVVANFEAVAQRVFEENRVKRRVMLLEIGRPFYIASTLFANDARHLVHESSTWRRKRDARCRWARLWIFENVEEIGTDGPVAPRISVARNAHGRGLGAEQRHECIVERLYGLRIAHAKVDVAEQWKRVSLEVTLPRFA